MSTVTIHLFDLELQAEVEIISTPQRGTRWEPPEDLEIEVVGLTHKGHDALWLRNSEELRSNIDDRAWDAYVDLLRAEEWARGEDLAQARAEDEYYALG